MESIKAIHDAGIQHGNLIDDTFRHILYDTTCEKAFIIDFSTAERHKCPLIMRMRPYTTTPSRATFGCDELWDVATNVSYFGNGPCEYLDWLHLSRRLQSQGSGLGADPLVLQANAYVRRERLKARAMRGLPTIPIPPRVRASTTADAPGHASRPRPDVAHTDG